MTERSERTAAWLGLASVPGVGRVTFRKLVGIFGSPEDVLAAPKEELLRRGGIPEKTVLQIASFPWQEPAFREIETARRLGVSLVTEDDPEYPASLRSAADAPLVLYIRGKLGPGDREAVAIVGTRTPTHYGVRMAREIAADLAAAGFRVVSGMARGIDTQAHQGALAAGGRTIAVLGSGVDVPYPRENSGLMERIAAAGAVVSENPFGTRPESGYFPARNRIISGLSRGTVIVEAAEDSGSLITADYTLKQGRKLFAVPGNVGSPVSRGTNSLIKQGAMLVESAADVLRAIEAASASEAVRRPAAPQPVLTEEESRVFRAVTVDGKHVDDIMTESGLPSGRLSGLLTALELKGLVKQLPGKYFMLADVR